MMQIIISVIIVIILAILVLLLDWLSEEFPFFMYGLCLVLFIAFLLFAAFVVVYDIVGMIL